MSRVIVGRILRSKDGKIIVLDVDTDDIYTLDRMSHRRLIEPREDGRSGYEGLLYEFEVDA
jgi:hypothetical protein